MYKNCIKNLARQEIEEYFASINEEKFRAKQLWNALYKQCVDEFDNILNFPLQLRQKLKNDFEIYSLKPIITNNSADGSRKILYRTNDDNHIETVFLPNKLNTCSENRNTICISTMVGCPVGCNFCATGKLGFTRNLSHAEIIDQFILSKKIVNSSIDNIVVMGMGEPLLNYENTISAVELLISQQMVRQKAVTLSTVGIPDKIVKLADSGLKIKIALSLHATKGAVRKQLIPTAAAFPIEEIYQSLDYYYQKTKLPITIEYILLKNINNSFDDILRLTRVSRRFPSKINIIPFNDISFIDSACNLTAASAADIEAFAQKLRRNGATVITRKSQGKDIGAACGQLAYRKNLSKRS